MCFDSKVVDNPKRLSFQLTSSKVNIFAYGRLQVSYFKRQKVKKHTKFFSTYFSRQKVKGQRIIVTNMIYLNLFIN